jgi:putative salt-induced outer membrane protein
MTIRISPALTTALAVGLAYPVGARPARAQDAKPVAVTLDVGFVNAAGNTRVTSLNAAENLKFKPAGSRWQFEEGISTVYGRNQDSVTAEQWRFMGRVDYAVLPFVHVFVAGTYERNRFAGIGRRFEEILGVTWRLMDGPRDLLSAELGSAVTQQRSTADIANNFVALRMAANYKHRFTEAAYVQQIVEALPDARDFDDTRVNSETALVAPLSSKVAF